MKNDPAALEAARAQLAEAPDDLEVLKAFATAAKHADRREEAVAAAREAYARKPSRPLYEFLRGLCTYPEFQSVPPPPDEVSPDAPKLAGGELGRDLVTWRPYSRMLDEVVLFPVSDSTGAIILISSAVLIGGFSCLPAGGLFALFFQLALAGYYWNVLSASGAGHRHNPGWPDFADLWEMVGLHLRWIGITALCFLPAATAAGSALLAFSNQSTSAALGLGAGAFALLILGCFYYPMALMLAGFSHSVFAALDLPLAIASIRRIPGDYLLAALIVLVCLGLAVAAGMTAGVFWRVAPLPLVIMAAVLHQGVQVYLAVLIMRAVGLLYYARARDLAWFEAPREPA